MKSTTNETAAPERSVFSMNTAELREREQQLQNTCMELRWALGFGLCQSTHDHLLSKDVGPDWQDVQQLEDSRREYRRSQGGNL